MSPEPHTRPKLLVTGAGGRIGSRLRALASGRFHVVEIGRASGVDLANLGQVERAVASHPDASALVHLAAFTDVSKAHEQTGNREAECWRINVGATENVVRACKAAGVHLVHVSTDFVFDGTRNAPYTEQDAPSPIEWYGRTKWHAEEVVRRATSGWTILRISFPYAAGPSPRPDFVRSVRTRLEEGGDARLFDDQTITPTFVDDVAQGLMLVARVRPRGELFHLVGSSSLTPFDFGLKIARAFHLDERRIVRSSMEDFLKKDPRPRQRRLRLSNAKWTTFATLHGLNPPADVDSGLARVRQSPA